MPTTPVPLSALQAPLLPFLQASEILPADFAQALLLGRIWRENGPSPAVLRGQDADTLCWYDLSAVAPTMSALLEHPHLLHAVRQSAGEKMVTLAESLHNASEGKSPRLLAPCDLQPVKAAGVTFIDSLLERVIEERARGDASRAQHLRTQVTAIIGDNLAAIRPGSQEAERLKAVLMQQNVWSQYLEVGIGPDAEVFTKAPPMSSVGTHTWVGLHPKSAWNNPEPEVVLAVNRRAQVVGVALGNDVNLRDFEGRSALLLGKAKDNNGACAIGPFLRLFDEHFGMDEVRTAELHLHIQGVDGFALNGMSTMARISRDPLDLVIQTIGGHHQYPDGFMLFCGTLFAPTQDRDTPGQGFTHKTGDMVTISSKRLGTLANLVGLSDEIEPWSYGTFDLMCDLGRRGLLK